jgi:hypothetical protein
VPGGLALREETIVSLTIADRRVDEMQDALRALMRARDCRKVIERELASTQAAIDSAAEAIYNATLYDPEGERNDAS